MLACASAAAQEGASLEGVLEAAVPATASTELRARAAAQPAPGASQQALAVFYHQRGLANRQLGEYADAVSDFKLALQMQQPRTQSSEGFGSRGNIENDLGGALE